MTEQANQQGGGEPSKPQRKIPRVEQAAILLMSLGEADAAEILKHMGPKEVQRVGVAMAQMKDVSKDEVTYVMNQFVDAVGGQTGLGVGNDEYIRTMLTQALGDDKASSLIDRILIGGNTTGLDTLKWMEPRAVGDIIRYEHPQIQAIVISYLDPDQAAEILGTLDEKVRLDVMMRVASLESIQPQALQELNDILEKQFSGGAASQTSRIGGVKRAADIMNFMDRSIEGNLMDSIKDMDPDLASTIEDRRCCGKCPRKCWWWPSRAPTRRFRTRSSRTCPNALRNCCRMILRPRGRSRSAKLNPPRKTLSPLHAVWPRPVKSPSAVPAKK